MKALILILFFAFLTHIYCEPVIIIKHSITEKCSDSIIDINVFIPDDTDLVQMQIQKTVYKKYEPIEILVRYINTGIVDDSIYYMFDDHIGFIDFDIKDEKGININEKEAHGFTLGIAVRPIYIVKPADTLIATITLNGFGKKTEDKKTYFQFLNYFPVGKYKFHAIIYRDIHRSFIKPFTTSDIEFEIFDNDETDMRIIDLSREGKFYDIQKNFSDNYFYEYALIENVRSNIGKYYKNEIPSSELENSYLDYFNKFPQSYYTIPFVIQYLGLVANDAATNVEYFAQILLNEYKNSPIEVLLKNSMMLPAMKLNIIESRKVEKRINR